MNLLIQLQFRLRNRWLGHIVLRSGLPGVIENDTVRKERAFYSLVLHEITKTCAADPAKAAAVVDIGCRNWSYAKALGEHFPTADLLGVELDGGRRYWNGYRRIDVANSYAAELSSETRKAECLYADFRKLDPENLRPFTEQRELWFTFFYPFVSEDPALAWGIPQEFADFGALLTHARKLSNAVGRKYRVLSLHQGSWEANLARESYQKAGLSIACEGVIPQERFEGLWPSRHDAYWFSSSGQ